MMKFKSMKKVHSERLKYIVPLFLCKKKYEKIEKIENKTNQSKDGVFIYILGMNFYRHDALRKGLTGSLHNKMQQRSV